MENSNIPLSLVMEDTRYRLIKSLNQIINENSLPAYLIEGILLELLSDIRGRKNFELMADIYVHNEKRKEEDQNIDDD